MKNLALLFFLLVYSASHANQEGKISYKCYEDFLSIAESRLNAVKESSIDIHAAVHSIQETTGVPFDDAVQIYQAQETPEADDLERSLFEIDSKIEKLMPFIKPDSGEEECKERMRLEEKRADIAKGLIQVKAIAVLKDMTDLRTRIDELFDPRLVGEWEGSREVSGCSALYWHINLRDSKEFSVAFYSDPEHKDRIAEEKGSWNANPDNGMMMLRTKGVSMPDVFNYEFLDQGTVEYRTKFVSPSGDCPQQYSFIERRVE